MEQNSSVDQQFVEIVVDEGSKGDTTCCITKLASVTFDVSALKNAEFLRKPENILDKPGNDEELQNSVNTSLSSCPAKATDFVDIVNFVQKQFLCFMCLEIMRIPCVCPTCGNFVGCKECLAQSHISLNEVRDANDYEPVDPMCPFCRENSLPFHPIESRAMEEISQKLRCCAINVNEN